jgi:hypothetical protein
LLKKKPVIDLQLCYLKLNMILQDLGEWDLSKLRDADKAEVGDLAQRARKLKFDLDSISTLQMKKLKPSDVREYKKETKEIVDKWNEVKWFYVRLNTASQMNKVNKLLGVLGLKYSPELTLDDIKRAYRECAKKCHPDAGGDCQSFEKLQDAYEELQAMFK